MVGCLLPLRLLGAADGSWWQLSCCVVLLAAQFLLGMVRVASQCARGRPLGERAGVRRCHLSRLCCHCGGARAAICVLCLASGADARAAGDGSAAWGVHRELYGAVVAIVLLVAAVMAMAAMAICAHGVWRPSDGSVWCRQLVVNLACQVLAFPYADVYVLM